MNKQKDEITLRKNFSETVLEELYLQDKSKRWLYLELKMTPESFQSRIENNDWRLGEIIKITSLLKLNG